MMTTKDHLSRARKFLAIAESKDSKREAYKVAAEEIAAAKAEDRKLTNVEVATSIRKSDVYVGDLLKWRKSGYKADTPFLMDEKAAGRAALSHTKKLLREAPLEQVETLIASLPKERQQAIGAAAGRQYMKARQEYDERERSLTPADKREREEAGERLTRPMRQAVAGFAALGIIAHLEQATEELRELTADGSLVPKVMRQIDRATDAWITELEFAKQMVGDDE